jgi:hypothetical protein
MFECYRDIFVIFKRRRRLAIAFWISLVWVAFAFWGLDCLQVEAAKVAKDRK